MMKKMKYVAALPFVTAMSAMAQPEVTIHDSLHPQTVLGALGYTALFGLLGLIMMIVGFKIFDKVITHIDLEGEIKKGNMAAAVLSAGVLIGLALIIAASMS